jgi:hypothetical protein
MLPPKDDFSVRTASPSQSLPALKEQVERAEEGGGWVPLVFSRICACPDKISAGDAISPTDFKAFVAWLADRPDSTRVRTVDQVMGGELRPVVGAPLPRVVPDPSSAIGSPASPADDESPWAFLGDRSRSQALALAAAVGLAILAALGAARRSNRGRAAVSVAKTDERAASSRRRVPKAALVSVAVVAVAALVGAAFLGIGDLRLFGGSTSAAPEAVANGSGAPEERLSVEPPAAFSAPGTYVQSRVTASGDVQVIQWVVTAKEQPISSLDLALPPLPTSGSVSVAATDLVVAADQVKVRTPTTVGAAGRVLRFEGPARAVYLAYTLRGAVETSESVPGRVLVRATTLSSRYQPRVGPTRVTVTGGAVLSMACAGPSAPSLSPCGEPVDGRWRAVLQGPDRAGGVAAVVTLT